MSTEGKINATAKNVEGKAEEALGNLTGDKEMQVEGKAKQAQASAMHAVENIKEAAQDVISSIKDAIDKA
jgi:uncharacterized protein YjbJ (UPF0337 family)